MGTVVGAMADEWVVEIAGRSIGAGQPVYIIAELSANHGGDLERAVQIVREAAAAGADAIKLQTYTPGDLTLDRREPPFVVGDGTLWAGRTLHDLYAEAALPLEWHEPLFTAAAEAGIACFSTPFSAERVAFLDDLGAPAHKIASFELVDLQLIRAAATSGKPLIMSTGMATEAEIDDALAAAEGSAGVVLLRCVSAYPAPSDEMDLLTIPAMAERFGRPVGLSDHTRTDTAAIAAVALGACVLEKHVTLRRDDGGPDAAFSLEPAELARLVTSVREVEAALGGVRYGPSPSEEKSLAFRRSLFVVADIPAGAVLDETNVRAIRPGTGLPPRALPEVLGRRVREHTSAGTPLSEDLLA